MTQPQVLNVKLFLDTPTMIWKDITNIRWLDTWKQQDTKLNKIKSSTFRWINNSLNRKEESVLKKLKIGHTRLMHGHLMAKKDSSFCEVCGVQTSVKHIITECLKYHQERQSTRLDTSLDIALGPNVVENKMILFLKSTGLYNLI